MNRQSSPSSLQSPPGVSETARPVLGRVLGIVRGLKGFAGAISLTVIAAEFVMPPHAKPSTLIGSFHGGIESADADAKARAVTELARQNADAIAQPPAMAHNEQEAFRVQMQIILDSLGIQSGLANITDLACVSGMMFPRGGDTDAIGQVLRGTCGIGDRVRDGMVETLKRAGQNGSTLIQRPVPSSPAKPSGTGGPVYYPVRP